MTIRGSALCAVAGTAALLFSLAGCASSESGTIAPKSTAEPSLQHYQMGRMFFEQGRAAEAMAEIERSLKLDPSLPQVWFYRGYIYSSEEQWEKAEADFRQALKLNELYTDARMFLAMCLDKEGRPESALVELDRALADHTFATPEQIYFNKALIMKRQGRLEDALKQLRRSVTIRTRYYPAHYQMGLVLTELGEFEAAEMSFEAAEPAYIKDPEFHLARGTVYGKLGRTKEAEKELRRVMEMAPGSEPADKASKLLKEIG